MFGDGYNFLGKPMIRNSCLCIKTVSLEVLVVCLRHEDGTIQAICTSHTTPGWVEAGGSNEAFLGFYGPPING